MTYFRLRPLVAAAAIAALVATVLLGNWQTRRAEQKILIQQRIVRALNDAPVAISGRASDPASLFWHRVSAQGVWQPDDVIYLDNRPNEGRVGLYVLMPLKLADGSVLIVNRGWLPRDPTSREKIAPYATPSGPTEVVGVALADENRFLELSHPSALKMGAIWENFDFDGFSRASGLQPLRLIVREDSSPADGLVRNWPDRGGSLEGQIERHRGYAFQWYAMGVALIVLFFYYGIRNARAVRHALV